jgi:hypothetical protein
MGCWSFAGLFVLPKRTSSRSAPHGLRGPGWRKCRRQGRRGSGPQDDPHRLGLSSLFHQGVCRLPQGSPVGAGRTVRSLTEITKHHEGLRHALIRWKEASAILHVHRWVRQFWRTLTQSFQPSERPRRGYTVADITRCGVPGPTCAADRNSSLGSVTPMSATPHVSGMRIYVLASGSLRRAVRRTLSTCDLFRGRRMICVPMPCLAGR